MNVSRVSRLENIYVKLGQTFFHKTINWKKIITTFVGQTGSKCKSKLFDFLNENIFRSTGECVTVFFLFSFLFTLALTVTYQQYLCFFFGKTEKQKKIKNCVKSVNLG